MSFQLSPGINTSEIDLTTAVPAVSVSTGALAGVFAWGPVFKITSVSSEVELYNTFSGPDNNSAASFMTAASFLAYSNSLKVARANALNQLNATANGTGTVINNEDDYFNGAYATEVAGNPWTARYPGAKGNSLKVYVWANSAVWLADSANTNSPNYTFANYFDYAPTTTPYVTQVSNGAVSNDAMHVLVVDALGKFTGTANTVLEKYQALSKLSDAQNPVGATNFYHEVIWKQSRYVYNTGIPSSNTTGWNGTISAAQTTGIGIDATSNIATLSGGADGSVSDNNIEGALALFANPEEVDISLLMTGDVDDTIRVYAVNNIAATRKDCVAFLSPPLANTQDVTGPADSIAAWADAINARSSYAVVDSGYKYMYDKYNDVYRWIPLNGDIAGLCAQTDNVRDPWWSPAGLQRGNIKNAVKLAFNPGKTDRDTLYSAGVNPVVSFPGQGILLYGDKTFLNYASAFDHINVRRLFIVLEKAISKAAQASLFEFNDSFTRASFVNLVTPFLRTVQGRRGISNFKVVCDTTNNTPAVISGNQFVGDIYIVPNYSINYIQLNFIATRTGVSFNEVVGQF